ncbi:MAG TPA: glycosyl transferase family 1 [Candidatus Magasanikbacteria bacterium]|nr:MAG: hypothetical protein A2479_04580 [Candidatus Magasanikbacteria bacterium RIFOXYC2_FULL_39_8]HAT03332.1 glycosyl transferase family 1 [Candidatus Magasanikbacteria bacterium]
MSMLRKIKKGMHVLKNNLFNKNRLIFISEPINWVIEEICFELIEKIEKKYSISANISYSPVLLKNKILHFASIATLIKDKGITRFHKTNKSVLSWYHILPNDFRVSYIPELNKKIDIIHTPCRTTQNDLIAYGFDKQKIVLIPEGIKLDAFYIFSDVEKNKIKVELNIPKDKIIIGSFQKDGHGWGEGLDPKGEKGPDVFCDVVEQLSKIFDIHVLLTGPARGYVKKRLSDVGISYTHTYLKEYAEIVKYYNVLDLYIISSRVEGGPKALLESWACGVPVVSTKVGMCADLVKNGENGFLAEVEDVDGLVHRATEVLSNNEVKIRCTQGGLRDVQKYSWDEVSKIYVDSIYKKLW